MVLHLQGYKVCEHHIIMVSSLCTLPVDFICKKRCHILLFEKKQPLDRSLIFYQLESALLLLNRLSLSRGADYVQQYSRKNHLYKKNHLQILQKGLKSNDSLKTKILDCRQWQPSRTGRTRKNIIF